MHSCSFRTTGNPMSVNDSGPSPIGRQTAQVSRLSSNDSRGAEAAQLQLEMRQIEERRKKLEEQRSILDHSRRSNSNPPLSSQRRSNSAGNRSSSAVVEHDPPGATHVEPIEPEFRRREKMTRTAYMEMKEAMKESWKHDSTLVSGYFITKPVGKGGTFPRAQRFLNPPGYRTYYLSNDMQIMQSNQVRHDRNRYTVMTRGNVGYNVNSHWNDSKGGTAPGPGAYTPRWAATTTGPRN